MPEISDIGAADEAFITLELLRFRRQMPPLYVFRFFSRRHAS